MARKKDVTLYAENPFMGQIADLKTRKRRVTVQSGKAILDTKTGEIEDVAEIVSVQHVDNAQFLKLYTGNLRQFFNLKPSTFKLVEVLLSQYSRPDRHHVDQVYLNISVAERYFSEQDIPKISKAAFHSAMKELIVKGFIAESTDPNMYWINPALFSMVIEFDLLKNTGTVNLSSRLFHLRKMSRRRLQLMNRRKRRGMHEGRKRRRSWET